MRLAAFLLALAALLLLGGPAQAHVHALAAPEHAERASSAPAADGGERHDANCCHADGAHCASPAGMEARVAVAEASGTPLPAASTWLRPQHPSTPRIRPKPPRA